MTDFVQKYREWAVIAGASEGIGASLADQSATRGMDLVLIARNGPLLEEVTPGRAKSTGCRRAPLFRTSPIRRRAKGPRPPTASTSGC